MGVLKIFFNLSISYWFLISLNLISNVAVKVSNLLNHTSILKQALFHSFHLPKLPLDSHFT